LTNLHKNEGIKGEFTCIQGCLVLQVLFGSQICHHRDDNYSLDFHSGGQFVFQLEENKRVGQKKEGVTKRGIFVFKAVSEIFSFN